MKIIATTHNRQQRVYDELKPGDVFRQSKALMPNPTIYMVVTNDSDEESYGAVNLSDGCLEQFDPMTGVVWLEHAELRTNE